MILTDTATGRTYYVSEIDATPTGPKCGCRAECKEHTGGGEFASGHDAKRASFLKTTLSPVFDRMTDGQHEALAEMCARGWYWSGPSVWSPGPSRFSIQKEMFLRMIQMKTGNQ